MSHKCGERLWEQMCRVLSSQENHVSASLIYYFWLRWVFTAACGPSLVEVCRFLPAVASRCRAQAPGHMGSMAVLFQCMTKFTTKKKKKELLHRGSVAVALLWHTSLVTLQHVESLSSWTRDWTHVLRIGGWILIHWTARKVLCQLLNRTRQTFPDLVSAHLSLTPPQAASSLHVMLPQHPCSHTNMALHLLNFCLRFLTSCFSIASSFFNTQFNYYCLRSLLSFLPHSQIAQDHFVLSLVTHCIQH